MPAKRIYSGSTAEERGRLLHNSSEESQTTSASPGQGTSHQTTSASPGQGTSHQTTSASPGQGTSHQDGGKHVSGAHQHETPPGEAVCQTTKLEMESMSKQAHTLPREKKGKSDSRTGKKSKSKSSTLSGATHKSSLAEQEHVSGSQKVAGPGEPEGGHNSASRRKKSPESRSASRGRASPGRPQQQKVVYYQNRFITIPIDGGTARADSGSSGKASASEQSGAESSNKAEVTRSPASGPGQPKRQQGGVNTVSGEMAGPGLDSTSINMQPIDMDKATAEESGSFMSRWKRRPAVLKKVGHYLQDNRMKTGDSDTQEKLRTLNKTQESSSPILKKILNIIFVTTGVSLLLAVVVVIIYTSIGKAGSNPEDFMKSDASRQQQQTTPPPTITTPTPKYKVVRIDDMDEKDYDEMQTNFEENDALIDVTKPLIDRTKHDYEGVEPHGEDEEDPDTVDADWREVNPDDDGSPIISPGDGGYGYKEVTEDKKDTDNQRPEESKTPNVRPKGDVSLGYVTVTRQETSTTMNPFRVSSPTDLIVDEYGVRENEYIHNYKKVRHHKDKEGGKHRRKLRDSRTTLKRKRPSSSKNT